MIEMPNLLINSFAHCGSFQIDTNLSLMIELNGRSRRLNAAFGEVAVLDRPALPSTFL